MSQPHPSQHTAVSDMQFLQQKLMYKQLQDLQRQQQLQQADQGARQQNSLSQMPAAIKPVALNQPAMMNEMPIHNVPSYMWANNFVGGLPPVPTNSHVFVAGNMNWAQTANPAMHNINNGIMSCNDQSPPMRYIPDQSFHGIPISSSGGSSINHYSQLSEISNDCNNLMTKEVGCQAEKVSGQFNSFQNNDRVISHGCLEDATVGTAQKFQRKDLFGHASMGILNSDDTSMNLKQNNQNQVFHGRQEQPDWSDNMQEKPAGQLGASKYASNLDPLLVSGQFNSFQNNDRVISHGCLEDATVGTAQKFQRKDLFGHASMGILNSDDTSMNLKQNNQNQVFHGRQEQPDWSDNMQEKPAGQLGASKYASNLDPTEQKFLFGTDDGDLGNSMTGGFLQGLPLENDYLGGFPSIHSGSWSALMQEAVQSSTSDKETQEEWSGLDFQKMEQAIFKPPITSSSREKQLGSWNNSNVENASLTMKPLPLFNDTEAGPSSCDASTFQPSFETTISERNRTQTDASHLPFQLSSSNTNDKQLPQVQKQSQLPEFRQAHVSENNEMWVGQSYQQQGNSSSDMQHIQGSWTHQDLHMSNNARRPGNMPNDWNTNYRRGVANSKFSGDENMPNFGIGHANLSSGVQSVENNIGVSQVHSEGSLSNYSYFPTLNNENNQQIMSSQKVGFGKTFTVDPSIKSESNQNEKITYNQNWELPPKTSNERLSDNYDSSKDRPKLVSGEGHVSNRPYGHQSNIVSGEKKFSSLAGYDQRSLRHECQKTSARSDIQTVESDMFQNQRSNFGLNMESPYDGKSWTHFQGPSNSFIEGSKREEKIFTGKPTFNRQIVPNDRMDITKRTATRAEEPQFRDAVLVHDSTSFEQSAVHLSQGKNISQTSENMLELLPKVEQSGNYSSFPAMDKNPEPVVNTSSALFNQSSGMQGFGLRLAPPSQRQQNSHFALSSQMSPSDVKSRQFNKDVFDNDQMMSTYVPPRQQPLSPNKSLERENLSNISGEKHNEASDSGEQLRSPMGTVSGLPYLGNQQHQEIPSGKTYFLHQQHQRQHFSGSSGLEVSHQAVNFPLGRQTNEHALIKNSSSQWKPQDSRDGVVTGQSVPPLLSTPVRGVPPSRLVPLPDTHLLANSKSSSSVTDNIKKMVAGFPQAQNSGPPFEERSGPQISVAGMVQQAEFSRMLHNVWSNISAQQRLGGLHPAKITPQLLQSIINNNRVTSSVGLQKGDDQGNKDRSTPEVSTGYSNKGHGDEHQVQGNFLNPPSAEMDSSSKAVASSQGEEVAQRVTPGGGSSVSVSSLVRLYQQGMERGKDGLDTSAHFQVANTSASTISSSNSDIGFSGRTSMPVDARQLNYSLLHQMQAMKGSDSDPSKMLGRSLKGTDFISSSNASQTHWNTSQKSLVQNPSSCIPGDGKVSASSQGAFSSDLKKLNFGSKHENSSTTNAASAGEHDLHSSMQPHCTVSATNLVLGAEQNQISSQMAPSWFEKYGNYKNGAIITSANFNSQPSMNAPAQYLFPKDPRRISYNLVADQRSDDNVMITHGQGSVVANVATNEISSHILHPPVLDHAIAKRSKKRKSMASKLPWHRLVTEGSQRLLSISTAELDWAYAANRLIEKVGDEIDTLEDGSSVMQPRRRLILTTQLMQRLLPAAPARILKEEATSSYESMTFCVAKSILADACGILSLETKDSTSNLENESWTTKKLKTSKGDNVVEDFIERSNKLESDFLRLEKKTSLLDVRLECQELERFSTINRLGKFHGRPHTDVTEGSSNPEAASLRTFMQRYVTPVSPPGNLPEGIMCFSI